MYNDLESKDGKLFDELDLHNLAVADKKPEHVDTPKPTYFITGFNAPAKSVLIGLAVLAAWVIAEFVIA